MRRAAPEGALAPEARGLAVGAPARKGLGVLAEERRTAHGPAGGWGAYGKLRR